MFLIFDTETTGLPLDKNAPLTNFDNWPRVVQIAWQIHDEKGKFVKAENHIIKPDGFIIPINASMVHGISTEHALNVGENLNDVLDIFFNVLKEVKYIVGHNVSFDLNVTACEFLRIKGINPFRGMNIIDTCTEKTADFCKLSGGPGRKFKKPKLAEIHQLLFNEGFDMAHNASADVEATARVFLELVRINVINEEIKEGEEFFKNFKEANPEMIKPAGIKVVSNIEENKFNNSVTLRPCDLATIHILQITSRICTYTLISLSSTVCRKCLTLSRNVLVAECILWHSPTTEICSASKSSPMPQINITERLKIR